MTPTEFVMEFAGIVNLIGSTPPTDEQWGRIREMHQEAVGHLVKNRILERAETLALADKIRQEDALKNAAEEMKNRTMMLTMEQELMRLKMNSDMARSGIAYASGAVGKPGGKVIA